MNHLYILLALTFSMFSGKIQADDPWNGIEYNKYSIEQRYAASSLIQQLKLVGDEKILDIGCGDGYNTSLLANKIPQGFVLGIDRSSSMIAFAASQYKLPNLAFELMDANSINFDQQFDLIVSFTVFHWIKDAKNVLNKINHSLKIEGRLFLEMPCKVMENVHPLHQAAKEVILKPEWNEYFIGFDPQWYFRKQADYEDLLKETHFDPVHVKTYLVHNTFSTKELFFHSVKQWFPYLKPLPDELKDIFLNSVINRYLEIVMLENDEIPFHVHRIFIEAQKKTRFNQNE